MRIGLLSEEFWAGKRVFVTGHTGFKGSWLVVLLDRLGAETTGYSLPTVGDPSLFSAAGVGDICRDLRGDVRDLRALQRAVEDARPEIVVHLAAQAIVGRGLADPFGTMSHNVLGTAALLEAVRRCGSATAVVVATTDKVYRNRGRGNGHGESDPLGGNEPYGVSKACAELVTECYREAFLNPAGIRVASARAGNVVGGGDWGEHRLVPDIVRAWEAGKPVLVRNPRHVRPWQYVLDVLAGYLTLAERLCRGEAQDGPYNFGPRAGDAIDVASVVARARTLYPRGEAVLGSGDNAAHESDWLTIDPSKARRELGFVNRFGIDEALRETFRWYRLVDEGQEPLAVCRDMITAYGSGGAA
ncbi:CDP-glucose 4,6-dehydratase [Streptomyces sp. NBC_00083]|uniref:CDP-glucose 4,6-dehydratase n=1 Tax=Streptomyces sp. NBC_00083 TaxID=2975647 RepID=UPI00224F2B17|nr:CDP-glucose 4,6-dehydratase [Streptomyces sp. NBC_00083]MCX5386875.1 CDP-glucose 4,6-dehydratase [Streptomyces sp. NBC_00083]